MKAESIQIKDWVRVFGRNGNPSAEPHWYNRKVTSDWIVHMERHEATLDNLLAHGVVIDEPQIGDTDAIPLTEEILIANGFFKNSAGYRWKSGWHLFQIIKCERGLNIRCSECYVYINSVHDLQRVLRCCGLFDLANNFKV